MTSKAFKIIIFLTPLALLGVFFLIKIYSQVTYVFLIREDSLFEYAQVVFYSVASLIAMIMVYQFYQIHRKPHAVLYLILSLGLLFVAVEEISWGQRIFNFENTEFFSQNNVQNEVSLHNLSSVQPYLRIVYILIGAFGALAWVLKLIFFKNISNNNVINFVIPVWYVSMYFFLGFFIYYLLHYIRPFAIENGFEEFRIGVFLKWRDEEFAELSLSLGFLIFVIDNYFKLNNRELSINR